MKTLRQWEKLILRLICCCHDNVYMPRLNIDPIFFTFFRTSLKSIEGHQPIYIYLFKFNNRNTRKRCEIFSKLTIKTPWWPHWRGTGILTLITFNILSPFSSVSALKISAGQRSLTVVEAFVTAEKPCRTVTMTANT